MRQPFSGNQSGAERPSLSMQHHWLRSGSTEIALRGRSVCKGFILGVLPRKTVKEVGEAGQKREKAQPGCCFSLVRRGSSGVQVMGHSCLLDFSWELDFHTPTLFSRWPRATQGQGNSQVLKALYIERQMSSSKLWGNPPKPGSVGIRGYRTGKWGLGGGVCDT